MPVKRIVYTIAVAFLFARPVSAAVLWDAPYIGGNQGNAYVATNVGGTLELAAAMVTSTAALELCSLDFYAQRFPTGPGPNNHLTTEKIRISIVGNYNGLNVWDPDSDSPQEIFFGEVSAADLAIESTFYPVTVTAANCVTLYPLPEVKYYVLFEPDYGASTSTGAFGIRTITNSNPADSRLYSVLYNSINSPQ